MTSDPQKRITCPKCGSVNVTLVAESNPKATIFGHEESKVVAYKCECGMAFTKTVPVETR